MRSTLRSAPGARQPLEIPGEVPAAHAHAEILAARGDVGLQVRRTEIEAFVVRRRGRDIAVVEERADLTEDPRVVDRPAARP